MNDNKPGGDHAGGGEHGDINRNLNHHFEHIELEGKEESHELCESPRRRFIDDWILRRSSNRSPQQTPSNTHPVIDMATAKLKDDGENGCDIVFCFDTTGSMSSVIDSVRQNLTQTIDRLFKDVPNIRIGLISHGDYCDYPQMMWKLDLSKDIQAIHSFIKQVPNTGGGDAPECYEFALSEGLKLSWKSDIKVFVIIGDEQPHEKGYKITKSIPTFQSQLHIDWKTVIEQYKDQKISIFSCHAMARSNQHSAYFWAKIANDTTGYYLPLEELGSFPDYMVGICLRAADSLDDFQLIIQRQQELLEQARKAKTEDERIQIERESLEVSEAIEEARNVSYFSPNVYKTASKVKSDRKMASLPTTQTRFETFSENLRTEKKSTATVERFLNTLSHTQPSEDHSSETKSIEPLRINDSNDMNMSFLSESHILHTPLKSRILKRSTKPRHVEDDLSKSITKNEGEPW